MKVLAINVVGIEDVHQIIYSVVGDKDNAINRAKIGRDFLDASLGSVDDFEKYLVELLADVRKQRNPLAPMAMPYGKSFEEFASHVLDVSKGLALGETVAIPTGINPSYDYAALERRIMNAIKSGDLEPCEDVGSFVLGIYSLESHIRQNLFDLISQNKPVKGNL